MGAQVFWHTLSFFRAIMNPFALAKGQAGDGREKALLEEVLSQAEKGNPQSVIQTVDAFAKRTWLMNVGDEKGVILDSAIKSCNPRTVLELGTYCGYSAIRIASQLEPDGKLITLEISKENTDIARKVIEHAGLTGKVQVVQGVLKTQLAEVGEILKELNAPAFDFVFIDHDNFSYLSDLLVLKQNGFLKTGTVVFADNMTIPGAPDYRRYLKSHPEEFEFVEHKCRVEYIRWLPDSVIISTCL